MKFLFVLDYFTPSKGGVEKVFEYITNYLLQNGHEVKVLTSKFLDELPNYEKKGNLEIYRVGKTRLAFMLKAPFLGKKLLKDVDIIHTSTYNAAYVAYFLSFFKKVPIILTSHEIVGKAWYDFKGKFKGFFYKKFEDLIYKFGFYYVFVSNHVKNVAITSYKLDLDKITTVYNGLDLPEIKNISKEKLGFKKDDIVGVFTGRPGWTKGLDFLLDNFDDIKKLNPKFKLLLLVLEKNNAKKIKKILSKIKNFDDIKILYEIPHNEVINYQNIADIGIVPSRTEGFGYSALEFSSLKKTCVFSFVGGIPEVNFGDIYFFKVGDKKSFLNAFKEIFEGKKNNYGYDKKLNSDKMVKGYEKLYNKFL